MPKQLRPSFPGRNRLRRCIGIDARQFTLVHAVEVGGPRVTGDAANVVQRQVFIAGYDDGRSIIALGGINGKAVQRNPGVLIAQSEPSRLVLNGKVIHEVLEQRHGCLLYTSPSPRDS